MCFLHYETWNTHFTAIAFSMLHSTHTLFYNFQAYTYG